MQPEPKQLKTQLELKVNNDQTKNQLMYIRDYLIFELWHKCK